METFRLQNTQFRPSRQGTRTSGLGLEVQPYSAKDSKDTPARAQKCRFIFKDFGKGLEDDPSNVHEAPGSNGAGSKSTTTQSRQQAVTVCRGHVTWCLSFKLNKNTYLVES